MTNPLEKAFTKTVNKIKKVKSAYDARWKKWENSPRYKKQKEKFNRHGWN